MSFTLTNGCRLKKTFTDIGEARQWRDWAMLEYGIELRDKGKNEKKEFSYSQYDTNNRGCLPLSDNGTREILDRIIL
ncbi:MAG: hypothetical protein IKS15_02545 [Opitutales bacterium]|nr:hypothetical protein [Opitutales bacterium]